MVDFACKSVKIDDIVKCALGLSRGEVKLLRFLVKNEGKSFSTDELSKKLKFDQSTVQRGVKKLFSQDILEKTQKNLDHGGYEFEYSSKNKNQIRKVITSSIKTWVKKVEEELCNL